MAYELFYWPGLQGRGEFVRLALEDAGADYVEVARSRSAGRGVKALLRLLEDETIARPPFAPPILRDGEVLVAQTAAILFYLGPRIGLAPASERDRLWTHQIQLTISDFVQEIHDVHHPIGSELYYEEQKPEALRRAVGFRERRMPKYVDWFERVLARSAEAGHWLCGAEASYADLSLFQIVEGLRFAFPKSSERVLKTAPRVLALRHAVSERARIKLYLASERRIPFNEQGIFRNYPELDG